MAEAWRDQLGEAEMDGARERGCSGVGHAELSSAWWEEVSCYGSERSWLLRNTVKRWNVVRLSEPNRNYAQKPYHSQTCDTSNPSVFV